MERAHAAGLQVGANVFITKANLDQLDELAEALRRLGVDEMIWGPAHFTPIPRARWHEALRPELADLLPHADHLRPLTIFFREHWSDLADHTEAAYVRRARAGAWPAWDPPAAPPTPLVCRPNLDLHTGKAGVYGRKHGNLRGTGAAAALGRAVAYGPRSDEALYFERDTLPSLGELAERFGNASGQAPGPVALPPGKPRTHPGRSRRCRTARRSPGRCWLAAIGATSRASRSRLAVGPGMGSNARAGVSR